MSDELNQPVPGDEGAPEVDGGVDNVSPGDDVDTVTEDSADGVVDESPATEVVSDAGHNNIQQYSPEEETPNTGYSKNAGTGPVGKPQAE